MKAKIINIDFKTISSSLIVLIIICLSTNFGLAQNVGVGTTTPTGKLTVADTLKNALTIQTTDNTKK